MEIVGIIALVIVILLAFSLLGWGLKILGWIFDFLSEGCSTSWRCLIWILAIVIGLMAVL
jgi:hypothetical protein